MADPVKIWTNGFKKSDAHPDFTASNVTINGVECDVSIWQNTDKNGKPYLSLAAKPPYKKIDPSGEQPDPTDADDELLPF